MGKTLAVIGGGPGGLCAAREAAKHGFAVTLFDRGAIGEHISCAEGFFDLLKLLGEPTAGIRFRVQQILLTLHDTFTIDCGQLHIWMIDRCEWQRGLAREAAAYGCVIRENTVVRPEDIRQMRESFDWIIDASGVRPVTSLELSLRPVRHALTAQVTLQGNFSALTGKLKAVFEPHYCGYYWVFPKERNVANVGVGWFGQRKPNRPIREELARILQKEGLSHYTVLKNGGGPIPVERRRQLVYGNILLVGDAAGLCSPLHGGGVDAACISGMLAARALAANQAESYRDSVEHVLGGRLNLEQKILDTWEKMGHQAVNERLTTVFDKRANRSRLTKLKQGITQELAVFQYVTEGRVQADWQNGLQLDGLPLLTKLMIKKMMNGEDP